MINSKSFGLWPYSINNLNIYWLNWLKLIFIKRLVCAFYLNFQGYGLCSSISYVSTYLFSDYCCQSCSSYASTTTSSMVTTTSASYSSSSSSSSSSTACVDQSSSICSFYINQGSPCSSGAYVNNVLFNQYCCASCSKLSATTQSSIASIASTKTSSCIGLFFL